MAAAVAFLAAVVAALPRLTRDPQADLATAQRMQQRNEFLHQEMTRLWQEVEQIRSLEGALVHYVLKNWLFWATAAAMLTEVCWLAWQRKLASSSEDDKGEQDLNRPSNGARHSAQSTQLPVQELPDPCRNLKQLVRDLLYITREFSRRTFMPEIYPDRGMGSSHEHWSIFENRIFYQLLVFLRPPPGHSFILEQDTVGQHPERCSDIRVVLECTCSMEDVMGYSLCFVHRRGRELLPDYRSLLLESLCTGFYLNVEQISSWVQNLLVAAWLRLPPWPRRRLTLLPCTRSCKFLVSSSSREQSCTEMFFAVYEGTTGSFVVLE
ncbi:inositol 1,4,5-trisphosphate receptor-interacting protein-like 1 [Cyanistes caeruleus]|uniref:inositol 1,4,5-trisphosphate receptor-interacting protein-like 1 n=1 Tax=Cyanistes caeruleus TaxID=156563 RepID=UPI000CDB3FDC|nr:inositol 1,4,5-trisphosphate receptor-interacting protein-like 1 [Cyanistes caeruleus]